MAPARDFALGFDALRLEGALLLPDLLEQAVLGNASRQLAEDYHLPRGQTLQEEIGRAFRIAQAQWKAYNAGFDRADLDAAAAARAFCEEFLRDALGYAECRATAPVPVGERLFPLTAFAAPCVPVVVAPQGLDLDEPDAAFAPEGGGSRQKAPFQLLQEFLNADAGSVWGLATNGRRIRLARRAAVLSRRSFIEFDLEAILGQASYAGFAALWRVLQASRAGRDGASVWETWREEAQRDGARVRERLREGVEAALKALGEGFLQAPNNEGLRRALAAGELTRQGYFEQLLRLVYRLIFLFVVEERDLLHSRDPSPEALAARRIYMQGYSQRRLRERCIRRAALLERYDDLWQAQVIVFRALAAGESRLALPALGGLFAGTQCPHLDAAHLSNRALLVALGHLRWAATNGTLAPVDYRNIGPEELGSVYESLLELQPEPDPHTRTFAFSKAKEEGATGSERKKTGSYYTPDSLVQELIRSALEPVITARIAAHPERPTDALLGISVIDPACGSGHFLLAAARRLADRLALLRSPDGALRDEDTRHAMREVITHCVYGVDRNPMALELARFALWLEGFEAGRPLGFLDHHLVCGDALIGITSLEQLAHGIPDAAFKPLSGDDKAVCRALAQENRTALKAFAKREKDPNLALELESEGLLAERAALEAMPDSTLAEQAAKEAAFDQYINHERHSRLKQAADLFIGAFLAPKAGPGAASRTPTSENLYFTLYTDQEPQSLAQAHQVERVAAAADLAAKAHVLHWPLVFTPIFQLGGFDCVLGNPPWERMKLQEEEFFATENPLITQAKNKAERVQRIEWLSQGMLARHLYPELEHTPDESAKEQETFDRFITARRLAEAASVFAHLKAEEGGRFPLTGVGDVNTYALFAETINQVTAVQGRAGFIVPTGIATDDSTKDYFSHVARGGRLIALYDFRTGPGLFSEIGHQRYKFCLLTLGAARETDLLFFALSVDDLKDERRHFKLTADDYLLLNPNTLTCPVFRSRKDAELTRTMYARTPVLVREERGDQTEENSWGVRFSTMFHMSNDSHLFADRASPKRLPLYEAKMIHQFDHRWASYRSDGAADAADEVTLDDKRNPEFTIRPRYWVEAREVYLRSAALPKKLLTALRESEPSGLCEALASLPEDYDVPPDVVTDAEAAVAFAEALIERMTPRWFLGFRDIARATDERTVIASILPRAGVGNNLPLMWLDPQHGRRVAGLLANLSTIVLDFAARLKVGGVHLNFFIVKQLPVLSPDAYRESDLGFIVPRVLELTYTSHDLKPWAEALSFDGPPFPFDPERRATLRAELDAYYARLYGLTREDLCYILDPASVMGADYPSETFRVLKENEEREHGEYRTQRLVLDAWDKLLTGELH